MWFSQYVYAQETAAPASDAPSAGTPGMPGSMMFLLLMLGLMYFLLIRPGQKREKERRKLLDSLAKGDRVITSGGVCGTIVGLNDKSVVLRVSDDPVMKMEFVRGAVSQVSSSDGDDED